jgi:5-methylcytosine-specific restriction endonuclease McrA
VEVGMAKSDNDKLNQVVSESRRARELREQGYREQALKMYPPICGRCGREFTRKNLQELTVHHRDHNHDNNPEDGSNWELLCMYCHDNEHQRQLEAQRGYTATGGGKKVAATYNPFADLKDMLDDKVKKG